jgi:hypothetical protein
MGEPKTRPTDVDPRHFIANLPDPQRRADAMKVLEMMERVTGEQPVMWGTSIIGFGSYPNRCGNRVDEWPRLGFSPRAKEIVLYVLDDREEQKAQLARLGKHRTGKACLYIKRLSDVDEAVLEELTVDSLAWMDEKYPRAA